MGWWSATILGGDTPMDYVGDMEDIAKVGTYDYDKDEDIVIPLRVRRERLKKALPELIKYCEERLGGRYGGDKEDQDIAYQVLGVLLISNGAELPRKLQTRILKAIREDAWANGKGSDSKERQFYIRSFERQIQRYPAAGARPRQVAAEGLFDAFEKALVSKEKVVLINKNR